MTTINKLLIATFIVYGLLFLYNILFIYIGYKSRNKSLEYALINNLYCGKDICPVIITNLDPPINITEKYDRKVARYCADLVSRVEELNVNLNITVKDIKQPSGVKDIGTLYNNKNYKPFGKIWYTNDIAWIVFRGTDGIKEWLQDFDFTQGDLPAKHVNVQRSLHLTGTKITPSVHSGFLEIYMKLRDTLYNSLAKVKPLKVVVTGHSLGAGVATICGLDLLKYGYDTQVYNFASPRVGDQVFCNIVDKSKLPLYRIVNSSDVIPTLPPSVAPNFNVANKPFFYNHCGDEHSFDINGQSLVYNHQMIIYINALDKKLV